MNSGTTYMEQENESFLPRISVVTPSYQQGEFIEETIRSIVTQEYPNLEYFIIDGGSTDQTIEIINRYKDKISYWVSEQDNGQTHALNKGFKQVSGDILAYVNSDDILTPGSLRTVGTFFRDHPEVHIIFGDAIAIDRGGQYLYTCRPGPFDLFWLIRTDYIPQTSVFFRKTLLKEIGYLDEQIQYAMDYDLLLKAGIRTPLTYLPVTLSKFRKYAEAKTSEGKFPFSIDIIYIIHTILKDGKYPAEVTGALMSTLFWRVMEACLDKETKGIKPDMFRNNSLVRDQCMDIINPMRPLFSSMRGSFSHIVHNYFGILSDGYQILVSETGISHLSIPEKEKWVCNQSLDSLIFAWRMISRGNLKGGMGVILASLMVHPGVVFNKRLYQILRSIIQRKK